MYVAPIQLATTPNISCCITSEEEMMDGFIFITKLALCIPYPISFDHILLYSYVIMPDQAEPDLDL
jgi:hypothetical protein